MPLPIEDYALIGDCHTCALVGKDGSVDWLCVPRFDSPACFAALLGAPENGRWLIAPKGEVRRVRRQYLHDALILETVFSTDDGEVALLDLMPPRAGAPTLLRVIEGRRGRVPMQMELAVRFDYGSVIPWVRKTDWGVTAVAGPDLIRLVTGVETHGEGYRTVAEFAVGKGQRETFSLSWCPSEEPGQPAHTEASRALAETERWWKEWVSRCSYQGEWAAEVRRSLMILKAMTYFPTGGIVAAPTTSLPVRLGGDRNWDYRYCWLRDATFTLLGLMNAGFYGEADAWRGWLLRAAAGKPSELQIMYGLHGERRLTELELPWLPGYQGASPVRIGNGAYKQHQLDVYGEVLDAMYQCLKGGLGPGEDGWRLEKALLRFLEENWDEPDSGLWETRIHPRHYTHSKVMSWVAFDRAVKSAEQYGMDGPVDCWRQLRDEIHAQVCREAFDPELNSFTQSYGEKRLDAALLMMPLVGFLPATDPRIRGTVAAIERKLAQGGFVARYEPRPEAHPRAPGESAFLLCNFWLVDCLHLMGRHADARRLFQRMLGLCNDVGLMSEGYDPELKRFTGNFPQAFSHIGLVNSAFNLSRQEVTPAEQRSEEQVDTYASDGAMRSMAAAERRREVVPGE
jgi:GH15 family glucan-1,4-alpha-glucosidase